MKVTEGCAACLYDKQEHRCADPEYLKEIRGIIENRGENDPSPLLVYRFNQVYERRFGPAASYSAVKKKYNDLMLAMEARLRSKIEAASDPLAAALAYARAGNYIDFGAMNTVNEDTLLTLLDQFCFSEADWKTYHAFMEACRSARKFLLLADNCGEIVLDRLFIDQLRKKYPSLEMTVMVRGGEVLNDATAEDAAYTGLDQVCRVVSNGKAIAGTVTGMLSAEGQAALDEADVILSKGQGNYESLSGQGRHVFYSFLCKCDLFTGRFQVPRLTGMFIEEC